MIKYSIHTLLTILLGMAVWVPANAGQTPPTASSSLQAGAPFDVGEIPTACPDSFMEPSTEGPYYKTGSPERRDLFEDGIPGETVILAGYVYDKNCRPIPGAWLDFWQADGKGNYDNRGFTLRGHQYTDTDGKYRLRTVLPGEYPGRTNHIHVKVRGYEGGAATTSQLYFPGSRLNESDFIFSPAMLVTLTTGKNGEKIAFFNFKLNQ